MTTKNCFTRFEKAVEGISLPDKFTFPFYYTPHPLCELAAEQLQAHIMKQTDWYHNFGLTEDKMTAIGKMFGVLIVENSDGEIGFLSAFSGKVADSNHLPGFVPPVFDMLDENGFFLDEQKKINEINHEIERLEKSEKLKSAQDKLTTAQNSAERELAEQRALMIEGRMRRKTLRSRSDTNSSDQEHQELMRSLSQESVIEKLQLRDLKLKWETIVNKSLEEFENLSKPLEILKAKRKTDSNQLQKRLFENYRFLNRFGEEKDLMDIFRNTSFNVPPAGAGECAAPKLLQYAFIHKLKPIAMAEFWWGESPKSEIRRHKNYYGSCKGKCEPILGHMLKGIEMDENPLLKNPAEGKTLDIIYQDEAMLVVNKPAEFLSVPGKTIEDSVYSRIKQMFPSATGSLIVHRLDMSTSGLMVIALNGRAHKQLQKQFISRSIQKRYTALIEGQPVERGGEITLPMRGDLNDRPRQLVCFQHGKPAETRWEVAEKRDGKTKIYLYPKTGRTHQLRVHCAHQLGLNMPIVGDDLYGQKSERLHLHADSLTLEHPITREEMHFHVDAEF